MKLPRPKTLSDFIRPLSALDLALVCLRMKGGKMSKTALSRAIASLSGVQTDVVAVLAHSDSASPTGSDVVLERDGERRVDDLDPALKDAGLNDQSRARLAFALLGASSSQRRVGTHELRGAIVDGAFGMGLSPRPSTQRAVREALVLHAYKNVFGQDLPLPKVGDESLSKLDGASSALLLAMAGHAATARDNVDARAAAIAARAVGAKGRSAEDLSEAVIRAACEAASLIPSEPGPTALEPARPPEAQDFATRIQELANEMTTPPFSDRVAIGDLYDAYGRLHEDAGSLASFKERLVAAKRAGLIQLRRLDHVSALDRELAQRSLLLDAGFESHFVARRNNES